MANPFSKGWKHLMASLDHKIDENADPKVQIEQAVEAAKKQHQAISQQAAEVIGNKKQLEMQLNRLLGKQEEYQSQARQAVQLADKATAEGDSQKASEYNQAAEVVASQLVSVEEEIESIKGQYRAAEQAAEQAQQQQKQSEARLKEQLNEVNKLRAQADQAAMQEKSAEAMDSMRQFNTDDSVPTLDSVREKIEKRYSTALGAQELSQAGGADRMQEITSAGRDMKASARLDEIRSSMGSTGSGENQLESGASASAGSADGAANKALTEGAGSDSAAGGNAATGDGETDDTDRA